MPLTTVLPNFLCVGVEKCGTTSLYDLLKQHSEIGLSRQKETHFFNSHWQQGLAWYEQQFIHLQKQNKVFQTIGEMTPAYHRFPEVISRIKQTLGDGIKIILMLREPRQRAFSHYIHDFALQPEIIDLLYKRYLATCSYSSVITQYHQAFGKENCLTLIFEEDFLPSQQACVDKVCDFLEVPREVVIETHSNPSFLPRLCRSPNRQSHILIENKTLHVPDNSLVFYTHRFHTSRSLHALPQAKQEWFEAQVNKAIQTISAIKSAIIYEQNVKKDIDQLEVLIDRDLSLWRKPLPDLNAKIAPQPIFLPI